MRVLAAVAVALPLWWLLNKKKHSSTRRWPSRKRVQCCMRLSACHCFGKAVGLPDGQIKPLHIKASAVYKKKGKPYEGSMPYKA